jgi:hypothetical protein
MGASCRKWRQWTRLRLLRIAIWRGVWDIFAAQGAPMLDFVTSLDRPINMIKFLLWLLLFVVCWPLALLALVVYPLLWIVLLPFRLLGIAVDGVFELLRAILLLPARLLGGRV